MDVDTIACEACGARLLFSTPSAWNQQQGMLGLFFSKFGSFKSILNYALVASIFWCDCNRTGITIIIVINIYIF